MVKCRNCIYYDGVTCTMELGKYFKQKIENPDEDVECDAYVDVLWMYLLEGMINV